MTKTTIPGNKVKKVLIVEDEGDVSLLLEIILNGKDLDLEHVKNLKAAEDYLQNEQPEIIILDNKLPDGFGVDFITFLKMNYPEIRIIMISGYDASVQDIALDSGADIFLEKPFTRDQLYQAIEKLKQ